MRQLYKKNALKKIGKILDNKINRILLLYNTKIGYSFFLITIIFFLLFKYKNIQDLRVYKHYINMCKKSIKLYKDKEQNIESPFFSICIPVYNMQNYIEASLLSILNQSFRNFEIVIINDYSFDNSQEIIKKLQFENPKIRLINHEENFGVYKSRIDAIRNAKGKYIIFLDPDDLFPNQNLLRNLYKSYLNYNQDIIEFIVIVQEESYNKLYYPLGHRRNHFHNFNQEIIYHPHLSNILFFENNQYTDIFCRCLWNKMVRKETIYKSINFLDDLIHEKKHFNFAEDAIINILNFEFASNYSNLNIIGYMYNIRKDSMSHANKGDEINFKMSLNMLFFYQLFYQYIKYFNKDLNYLYFDLKAFDYFFNYIKEYKSSIKKKKIKNFYKNLLNEANISVDFKKYIERFLKYFSEKPS